MRRIYEIHRSGAALALTVVLLAAACGRSPVAYGTAGSVIVTAEPELWDEVEDSVHETLEPRIFTVRDERTFELTYTAPASREWPQLRQWRQVLMVGEPHSPWLEPVLANHNGALPQPPALLEVPDVWARGQIVTVVLLPPGGGAEDVREMLPALRDHLDTRFREYALRRMYVSGRDAALETRLMEEAGFALALPQVYVWTSRDSVYVFRNDHPTPGRLERSVLVTWRSGSPAALDAQDIVEWRDGVGARYYDPPQVTETERIYSRRPASTTASAMEVQGIWSTPPGEWPAGGPFITRAIVCPEQDRTYLVDAWLFAPREQKYEYMLQLETILDTFRCGDSMTRAGG